LRKDSLGIGVSFRPTHHATAEQQEHTNKHKNDNKHIMQKRRVVSTNQQSQSWVFQGDPFPDDNEIVPLLKKDEFGWCIVMAGGLDQGAATELRIRDSFHHADAEPSYAVAETWGVEVWAAGTGSLTTGSVAAGAAGSVVAGASASFAGSAASSAGFSGALSAVLGEVLPLTVARSLANGDFGFSASSSEVVAFSFLFNHGRELLRLSLLTAGVSAALVSPFVVGAAVVSVGTVVGEATLVAYYLLVNGPKNTSVQKLTNGSVASTAGITGAVSETGSASLAGTAGATSSAFFSLGENWD
jgi:hypothetical protein